MSTPVLVRLADSNQTVTLDLNEADLTDDARFRTAIITQLSPFYPDIAHADIRRETTDGATHATVTKRAGTKGGSGDVLACLTASPEECDPAQFLAWELSLADVRGDLDLDTLLAEQNRIGQALAESHARAEVYEQSLTRLRACPPQPAPFVLPGV